MFEDELCLAEPEINKILIKISEEIGSNGDKKEKCITGEDLCYCVRGTFIETVT